MAHDAGPWALSGEFGLVLVHVWSGDKGDLWAVVTNDNRREMLQWAYSSDILIRPGSKNVSFSRTMRPTVFCFPSHSGARHRGAGKGGPPTVKEERQHFIVNRGRARRHQGQIFDAVRCARRGAGVATCHNRQAATWRAGAAAKGAGEGKDGGVPALCGPPWGKTPGRVKHPLVWVASWQACPASAEGMGALCGINVVPGTAARWPPPPPAC